MYSFKNFSMDSFKNPQGILSKILTRTHMKILSWNSFINSLRGFFRNFTKGSFRKISIRCYEILPKMYAEIPIKKISKDSSRKPSSSIDSFRKLSSGFFSSNLQKISLEIPNRFHSNIPLEILEKISPGALLWGIFLENPLRIFSTKSSMNSYKHR